jgi:hypothetical protein
MQIQINDLWRISTDPQNFIIEKKSTVQSGKTKGEVKWNPMGFYTTLNMALTGYCRRCMLDGEETTFDELKESLRVLQAEITAVKVGVKP